MQDPRGHLPGALRLRARGRGGARREVPPALRRLRGERDGADRRVRAARGGRGRLLPLRRAQRLVVLQPDVQVTRGGKKRVGALDVAADWLPLTSRRKKT